MVYIIDKMWHPKMKKKNFPKNLLCNPSNGHTTTGTRHKTRTINSMVNGSFIVVVAEHRSKQKQQKHGIWREDTHTHTHTHILTASKTDMWLYIVCIQTSSGCCGWEKISARFFQSYKRIFIYDSYTHIDRQYVVFKNIKHSNDVTML